MRAYSGKQLVQVFTFGVLYWGMALLVAGLYGLGWFFLFGTVRRIFLAFPAARIWITGLLQGEERAENERELLSKRSTVFSYALHAFIVVIWIGLTIFVFMKANVRFADFF